MQIIMGPVKEVNVRNSKEMERVTISIVSKPEL